jgi:hypothetical protein
LEDDIEMELIEVWNEEETERFCEISNELSIYIKVGKIIYQLRANFQERLYTINAAKWLIS